MLRVGEGIFCEARVVALGWDREPPVSGKAVVEKLLLCVPVGVFGTDRSLDVVEVGLFHIEGAHQSAKVAFTVMTGEECLHALVGSCGDFAAVSRFDGGAGELHPELGQLGEVPTGVAPFLDSVFVLRAAPTMEGHTLEMYEDGELWRRTSFPLSRWMSTTRVQTVV